MNEIEWLKSLDKNDPPPDVNVANVVLREIRRRSPVESFGWAALLATLAGGGAVAFALQAWITFQDPLTNFVDSLKLVLQ